MPRKSRVIAVATVAVLATTVTAAATAATVGPWSAAGTAVQARANDVTSKTEKRRVDAVPTPKLKWTTCHRYAQCATARLPRDYDNPKGPTTSVALLRIKARNPKARIGSLFLNPGGPGGSGTEIALAAREFMSKDVLDRFDIVGFDPRGIGRSANVRCFTSTKAQAKALAGMNVAFPLTAKEEAAYIASAKALGKACATTGKPKSAEMSTAEAARDMDVLRRAVGDKRLTYLGFSYGTALGQYYANMFPDRVRAVAVDGVINPVSWVGTKKTSGQILDDRLRSADGAYTALHEILVRCGKAGPEFCEFAGGDPVAKFDHLARRLRTKPIVFDLEGEKVQVRYADLIGFALSALYAPEGSALITSIVASLYDVVAPAHEVSAAQVAAAKRDLSSWLRGARAQAAKARYDNGVEAFSAVTCTDTRNPAKAESWPAATAKADQRAPYFGRAWGWSSVQCAGNAWSVRDEDAYTGPFNRRTIAPVLFVGNYYDPATNYRDAVSSNKLLPGSHLLLSDSWGHTAYGTSNCATKAIDQYLIKRAVPKRGTVCVGDVQPFTEPLMAAMAPQLMQASPQRPPVTVPQIPSVLSGTL